VGDLLAHDILIPFAGITCGNDGRRAHGGVSGTKGGHRPHCPLLIVSSVIRAG
jgi:hypothetical protein